VRIDLKEYLIGTGGWAYFHITGLHPLAAYSKAFNFVEVNSTFYKEPSLEEVEKWRRIVPRHFQFAVRAHRIITHKHNLEPASDAFESFEKTRKICEILRSEIIHLQTPPSLEMGREFTGNLRDFFSSVNLGKLRIVLEIRGTWQSPSLSELLRIMQDHNMIHCVDLIKDEAPLYKSDILYSRLFGKGYHNIYQPTDRELKSVDQKARKSRSEKVILSFHSLRMYKDAARMKVFKQTGKFPMVTRSTGLASLEQILREDTDFPIGKQGLIHKQGWKLFDLSEKERIHARDWLARLPEKKFNDIGEVIQSLKQIVR
jgi:uncharacterized protein YecE (DUF72 family)